MRKTRIIFLVALLVFNLVACSSSDSAEKSKDKSVTSSVAEEKTSQGSTTAQEAEPEPEKEDAKSSDEPQWEVGEGKVTTWVNSIDTAWVQIIVPVTNTGDVDLYLSSGTMDLEDESGHLVDSKSMISVYPDVLKPGETAYYYEETTLDEDVDSALSVVPHVDVKKAKVDCKRFEVSDLALKDEQYGGVALTGRVENTSKEAESLVYIAGFLYDANNEMIATVFTMLSDELAAGDKIGFSAKTFSAPDFVTADAVDHYEVYAYPMQFQF